jgi:hypothetical protein
VRSLLDSDERAERFLKEPAADAATRAVAADPPPSWLERRVQGYEVLSLITPDGKVKVLDFGLAKALGSESAERSRRYLRAGSSERRRAPHDLTNRWMRLPVLP